MAPIAEDPLASLRTLLSRNKIAFLTGLLALAIYLFTLQLGINGTYHPYKMDVGEIQNALPRWGTLHDSGYPLYALLGSVFVTALRPLGIPPAAGASLFSAVWGAFAVALLARLALELEAPPLAAMVAALLFGLSTSMWVDSSIAEVHTMTMALTLAAVLTAVRFGRTGQVAALYWLALLSGQGLAHQRAFAFLAPGLLLLILPQWRVVWRKVPVTIALVLLGVLTYVYIPLQGWAGVTWQFEPITWRNILCKMANTKAESIVAVPGTTAELWTRLVNVTGLLDDDLPLLLLLAGLIGLLLLRWSTSRAERWGLTLCWLAYLLVSLIIWEGYVSDALLAVKMPVAALAALGLALLALRAKQWKPFLGRGLVLALLLVGALLYLRHRPAVLALTRDDEVQERIALASQVAPDPDGRPTTFVAFWGNAYWQLAYAQAFEGRVPHLHLVCHTQDLGAILDQGHRLVTYSKSFRTIPIAAWEQLYIGSTIYLSSVAPGIVEIQTEPRIETVGPADTYLQIFDHRLAIREINISMSATDTVRVAIEWQALQDELDDYGAVIEAVARDPTTGQVKVRSQLVHARLIGGAYPTSRLKRGELVWDHVELDAVENAQWLGVYAVSNSDGHLIYRRHEGLTLPLQVGRVTTEPGGADVDRRSY